MTASPQVSPSSAAPGDVVTVTVPVTEDTTKVEVWFKEYADTPTMSASSSWDSVDFTASPVVIEADISSTAPPGTYCPEIKVYTGQSVWWYYCAGFGGLYWLPGTQSEDLGLVVPTLDVQ